MALKLAGERLGIEEKVKELHWKIGLPSSGDLEAGTKTITATSKQATPDYTGSVTVPASPDARLVAKAFLSRLMLVIDSMTAGQLSFSVELDGVERHSGSFSGTGNNYHSVELAEGLVTPGTAVEVKIYLWVDSGDAVVSRAQHWIVVGSNGTSIRLLARLLYAGVVGVDTRFAQDGTGTHTGYIFARGKSDPDPNQCSWYVVESSSSAARPALPSVVVGEGLDFCLKSTGESSSLFCIDILNLTLRSIR